MIWVEFALDTLALGSLYAIMSLGLVFVYGILNLVNFAYGEYIMFGGYILYLVGTFTGLPWWGSALLAIGGTALLSYLSEVVAFRPVRNKSMDALLVTSFAISILLQNGALLLVSPRSKAVPLPDFFNSTVSLWGVTTPLRNIIMIVTVAVLLIAVVLLMKKTVLGIAMRAAAEDFTTTRLMGIPANLVIATAFILSGLLAGVTAFFWVGRTAAVNPTMGAAPLLIAFVAVVIGGMNSLPGSVLGGFIYAILFNVLGLFLPAGLTSYREAIMFIIVIIFLVLRPEGLLRGTYTEERVG